MGDPIGAPGLGGGSATPAPMSPGLLPARQQPKQLTAAIKSSTSLEQLALLCQSHQAVLNPIHIAAAITKLPKLYTSQSPAGLTVPELGYVLPPSTATATPQQLQMRQLLQQLLALLAQQGCKDHSPRGLANIAWALARLQSAPGVELWGMLLDSFFEQLGAAVPQDVSNLLWAAAKLTKERTSVLQGTATGSSTLLQAAHAPGSPAAGAADPVAAGSAAASRPLLQQAQVRLLLQHLCKQPQSASVQTISNSLWAVVVLQHEHQWCMCDCMGEVQTLLTVFCAQPEQAMPGHIQPVMRCMAQLATSCRSHAGSAWLSWQPPLLRQLLEVFSSQREQLEMHHVSSVLRDVAQIVALQVLLQRQARDKQQQGDVALGSHTVHSSESSLPSVGDAPCAAPGLAGLSGSRISVGIGGVSGASSSTASSSSLQGLSPVLGSAHLSTATTGSSNEDAEEVLLRLAAAGGPQDPSSTVLALTMLRPQLQQLGVQHSVAALVTMLPAAALINMSPDVAQQLLAAASTTQPPSACAPGSILERPSDMPFSSLPFSSAFAARVLSSQSSQELLPLLPVPLAVPGSVSSSSSSNAASPSALSPVGGGGFVSGSPIGPGSSLLQGALAAAGLQQGSNPGHSIPGHDNMPGGLKFPGGSSSSQPGNTGSSNPGSLAGLAAMQAGSNPHAAAAAAAGASAAGEAGGDTQEEAAARQLTHNIAYADSVFQLADIFTSHASVMDMIHLTACITRLSKVLGTAPSQAAQAAAASLLPLLGQKLLAVLPHANARGIANVLWGYGRLRALPQTQLLPPLVEAFLNQLPTAACRDSAVVLWSLARLSESQGDPVEASIPPPLLRRLGREVLHQLAVASQDAGSSQPPSQQQQRGVGVGLQLGGPSSSAEGPSEGDVSGPPSSRDISNSLMALARLGFIPENDAAAEATGAAAAAGAASAAGSTRGSETGTAATAEAASSAEGQAQGLVSGLQGLLLSSPTATAAGASPEGLPAAKTATGAGLSPSASSQQHQQQLTLPLSDVKAVVDYLLKMAATAKTLDLQETATALKQLGLRELHAKVAAAVITHHGSAHAGPSHGPGGFGFMQLAGPGNRLGGLQGRQPGPPQYGSSGPQYGYPGGMLHQQRQQQQQQRSYRGPPGAGSVMLGGGGGYGSPYQQQQQYGGVGRGQGFEGPGQGFRPAGGYMGAQTSPAGQVLRQQQQAYMQLPASPVGPSVGAAGARQGLGGYAALTGGMGGGGYGRSAAAGAAPAGGYTLQYAIEQQQQPALLQQQQGSAAYAPQVQYMLLPQQQVQQQQPGPMGYAMQPRVPQQQQQAEFAGMPVLQQQVADSTGAGFAVAGAATPQQYFLQLQSSAPTILVPGMGVGQEPVGIASGGAQQQQQLLMQVQQQQQGSATAPGAVGQFGAAGTGLYKSSTAMLGVGEAAYMGDTLSASTYGAAMGADMLMGGQQQQLQAMGLYQAQQHVDTGAMYLQQRQQQQQLPVLYGAAAGTAQQQQAQQQQQAVPQAGVGTFAVLDPSTGMYHFQQ